MNVLKKNATHQNGELGASAKLSEDDLIILKSQVRKILHRMNNDMTAMALSIEAAALNVEESAGQKDNFKTLGILVTNLTQDLREMAKICRG